MAKRSTKILSLILCGLFCCVFLLGCGEDKPKYIEDTRNITDAQFTTASVSSVDALGRVTEPSSDREDDRDVGLFYFLWLGAHSGGQRDIYDITQLLESDPDELWSGDSDVSPTGAYHFWGEPLYGYYHAADPWVLTRHIELFVAAGIDYLIFDTTNGPTYDNVVRQLLVLLDKYQKQGFDVPKVAYFTNAGAVSTVTNIYNNFYKETSTHYYPNLWYSPDGKPMIVTDLFAFDEQDPQQNALLEFFDARYTQWPDAPYQDERKFPWMSFKYPQMNHNGVISVSVAQHTSSKMSLKEANWGRGYSRITYKNSEEDADKGVNYQSQWDTVFNILNKDGKKSIKTTFLTGWNEWIAIKFFDVAGVHFVDLFNKEYSRDLEMMKGGYGDNFYLQTVMNAKQFRYGDKKYYTLKEKTIDLNGGIQQWESIRSYKDFSGDAMERNYQGYNSALTYTDTTNRNDITDTKVTHDADNIYVLVQTAEDLTPRADGDKNWMNVWLGTEKNKTFNYVANRTSGKLSKINADGTYTDVGDIQIFAEGNTLMLKIPRAMLGQTGIPAFRLRVSDNVDASDRMNFYIQGDSAPIGELGYTYGTFL